MPFLVQDVLEADAKNVQTKIMEMLDITANIVQLLIVLIILDIATALARSALLYLG
jgi:hypothetical protein